MGAATLGGLLVGRPSSRSTRKESSEWINWEDGPSIPIPMLRASCPMPHALSGWASHAPCNERPEQGEERPGRAGGRKKQGYGCGAGGSDAVSVGGVEEEDRRRWVGRGEVGVENGSPTEGGCL